MDGQLNEKQAAWERRQAIKRALVAGMKQTHLAKKLGLSQGRIWQMNHNAREDDWRVSNWGDRYRAPLEVELAKPLFESKADARMFLASCERSSKIAAMRDGF